MNTYKSANATLSINFNERLSFSLTVHGKTEVIQLDIHETNDFMKRFENKNSKFRRERNEVLEQEIEALREQLKR